MPTFRTQMEISLKVQGTGVTRDGVWIEPEYQWVMHDVDVTVDHDAISKLLAPRAAANKSGISKDLQGAVVCVAKRKA